MSPEVRAGCRYFYAHICFELKKYQEAEQVLLQREGGIVNVPKGAAGYQLLGRICKCCQRRDHAIKYFKKSLELNPFLWSSYEQLCQLGQAEDPNVYFSIPNCSAGVDTSGDAMQQDTQQPLQNTENKTSLRSTQQPSPTASFRMNPRIGGNVENGIRLGSGQAPRYEASYPGSNACTPKLNGDASTSSAAPMQAQMLSFSSHAGRSVGASPALGNSFNSAVATPSFRVEHAPNAARLGPTPVIPYAANQVNQTPIPGPGNVSPGSGDAAGQPPPRRSARLNGSQMLAEGSRPNKRKPQAPPMGSPEQQQSNKRSKTTSASEANGRRYCTELFRRLARGYMLLCRYNCKESLLELDSLPQMHKQTGWVLAQMGRAYFECTNYAKAIEMFKEMRRICNWRMEGLEIYSTALWHRKKEVDLSFLAQQVKEADRQSPETWITIGNCFSLQKEPERAIAFFQRAIQLRPDMAYGYTLCAHEYVANEDFDKAIQGYRQAIRLDPRHYNAWYGLGNIYMHQEKFDLAIYHFRRAIEINPRSAVLYCFLGMTFHASMKTKEALRALEVAVQLEPNNPLACYQKARVLMDLDQYQLALADLRRTTEIAPTESSAHFTLGKVYKKLGKPTDALQSFSLALNLNPKDKNTIKHAMTHVYDQDTRWRRMPNGGTQTLDQSDYLDQQYSGVASAADASFAVMEDSFFLENDPSRSATFHLESENGQNASANGQQPA